MDFPTTSNQVVDYIVRCVIPSESSIKIIEKKSGNRMVFVPTIETKYRESMNPVLSIDPCWLDVGNQLGLGCIRLRAVAVAIKTGPLLLDIALAPHVNPYKNTISSLDRVIRP